MTTGRTNATPARAHRRRREGSDALNERIRTLGLFLCVAVVLSATALAAAGSRDPNTLVLRQTDIPGASYEADEGVVDYIDSALDKAGLSATAANYLMSTFSKQKGFLQIQGVVLALPSSAQARKALQTTRKAQDAFIAGVPGDQLPNVAVSLPAFGDQQIAVLHPAGNEGIASADLYVRKRSVVWWLHVTLERRPRPSNAEILAEVKRFAAKQKTRVGAG